MLAGKRHNLEMAKEEWAISGKYLLKALEDLEDAGVEASKFAKLLGYSNATDLIEAVEVAEQIPPTKRTPKNTEDFDNPDFNFIPTYFVINDFLAHTLYEEMILFMSKEYFDENSEKDDWGFDLVWEEIEETEEDFVYLTIGKEAFDAFGKPMVTTFIDRLIYADGQEVELHDVLEHYGNLKKHFLDLDNSFWYGKSFMAQQNPGMRTPYGLKLEE